MTVFIASFELLKIKGLLFVMVIIYLICRAIEEKKEISRLESRYPDLGIKKYYRYDVKEKRKNALIFWLSIPLIWAWCVSMILLEENEIVDIDSELLVYIPIASFILTIYLLRKMVKKSNVIGERIILLRRGIIPDDDTAYEKLKIQDAIELYPVHNIRQHYQAEKRKQIRNSIISFCYYLLIPVSTILLISIPDTGVALCLLFALTGVLAFVTVYQKAQRFNKIIQDHIILLQHGCIPEDTATTQPNIFKVIPLMASILLFAVFTCGWNKYQYKKEQTTLELIQAIKNNDTEQVQNCLSSFFADVNAKNKTEETPLHLAVKYAKTEIVKTLLATPGIDVNAKNIDKETPLHLAVKDNQTEIVKNLLAAPGIDVNAKNNSGNTPSDCYYCKDEIRELLNNAKKNHTPTW